LRSSRIPPMPNPATSGRMSAPARIAAHSHSLSRLGAPAAAYTMPIRSIPSHRSTGAGGFVRSKPVIQRQARMRRFRALTMHGAHWHGPSPVPASPVTSARLELPGKPWGRNYPDLGRPGQIVTVTDVPLNHSSN
jgi:hypothetical protein